MSRDEVVIGRYGYVFVRHEPSLEGFLAVYEQPFAVLFGHGEVAGELDGVAEALFAIDEEGLDI